MASDRRGDFKASLNCDQADEFHLSAQIASLKNMTILNQCAPGCGLGRPGDGVAASFF